MPKKYKSKVKYSEEIYKVLDKKTY